MDAAFSQRVSYNYNQKRFNPYLNRISCTMGVGIGAYNGELSNFFKPAQQSYYMNPGAGLGLAYRFFDHLSLRLEANIFRLYAEGTGKYEGENRVFDGINFDYYMNAVVDLFPKSKIDGRFYVWDAHIFGGIGQIQFFPKDNKTGSTKIGEILSDSTSGEYDYARLSVIYPVGAGIKYYLDKNHYISLEGNYRFTRTDFLDAFKDLSHKPFDKYFTLFFKYTVIIDPSPLKSFEYNDYIKRRKKHARD